MALITMNNKRTLTPQTDFITNIIIIGNTNTEVTKLTNFKY